MPSTFYELYNGSLNEAFIIRAREQLAQGLDGMDCAQAYAESFAQQFHRPFPLVKLEAQKDRLSAQQVRQGRRIRRGAKSISMN